MCTCVLGTDEGHLISVRFEADESTFSVHGLPGVWMESIEPEGISEYKGCWWLHGKYSIWPGSALE